MKRQTYDSQIVAISADLDLALLKIEQDDLGPFKTVPIAAADDALREGQTVFAIGILSVWIVRNRGLSACESCHRWAFVYRRRRRLTGKLGRPTL